MMILIRIKNVITTLFSVFLLKCSNISLSTLYFIFLPLVLLVMCGFIIKHELNFVLLFNQINLHTNSLNEISSKMEVLQTQVDKSILLTQAIVESLNIESPNSLSKPSNNNFSWNVLLFQWCGSFFISWVVKPVIYKLIGDCFGLLVKEFQPVAIDKHSQEIADIYRQLDKTTRNFDFDRLRKRLQNLEQNFKKTKEHLNANIVRLDGNMQSVNDKLTENLQLADKTTQADIAAEIALNVAQTERIKKLCQGPVLDGGSGLWENTRGFFG